MFNKLNQSFSIIRLIIVLLFFFPIVINEYYNHKSVVLYAEMIYVPFYKFILCLFIPVLIFDVILFVKKRKIKSLTPSILGVILIITSISINIYHNYKIYQKSIFKAASNWVKNKDLDIQFVIEFKENNNYLVGEIINQGMLINFYYGNYTKKDSIYILDSQIGENKISSRFVIRTIKIKDKEEKQLIQLNQKNIEIRNKFQFKIN